MAIVRPPVRWVILENPWWECVAAGLPYLMEDGDYFIRLKPDQYQGPLADRGEVLMRDVVMLPHKSPQLVSVYSQYPQDIILYETENLLSQSYWQKASFDLRDKVSNKWWNYSPVNAAVRGDLPVPLKVRAGTPPQPRQPKFDVLFVGSLNSRRQFILNELQRQGVSVNVVSTCVPLFGHELRMLESRAKVVLNIHYYLPGIFESFRVVPAVSAGACVLSETSEGDEGSDVCECVPYTQLVRTILGKL